jgi:zinc protease
MRRSPNRRTANSQRSESREVKTLPTSLPSGSLPKSSWRQLRDRCRAQKIWLCVFFLSCLSSIANAIPSTENWKTESGAGVYFVRIDSLPMVDVVIQAKAGSCFDPPDQRGLAELTAATLNSGIQAQGAEAAYDEGRIADGFARVGAEYSTSVDMERAKIYLRVLSAPEQSDPALNLVEKMLERPAFVPEVVERKKQIALGRLQDELLLPGIQARRALVAELYPEHPCGQLVTQASLAQVTAHGVQDFYRQHYAAPRVNIVLVGDLTPARARDIAERLSRNLPQDIDEQPASIPEAHRGQKPEELRIAHPAQQAHIHIGQITLTPEHPDYLALMLANHVFGGRGLTSQLMQVIREENGLAYSVYSQLALPGKSGVFILTLQTRRDQADKASALAKKMLQSWIDTGPSSPELAAAKQYLIRAFPASLSSNAKYREELLNMAQHGLPLNYLENWQDQIRQIRLADVRAALRRHLDPKAMVTVIVGVDATAE